MTTVFAPGNVTSQTIDGCTRWSLASTAYRAPLLRTGRIALMCPLLSALAACQAQGTSYGHGASTKLPRDGQTVWLTLHGYNYTDHYIDSYSVNGAWGGNLFISSATGGGGKSTCCVRWVVGQTLPVKVHVRWESSACIYFKRVEGQDFKRAKQFFSEREVRLRNPVPDDPQYFETHFYPDGHVEVAVTDDYSPPRLKLNALKNGRRPGVDPWPKCTPEQLNEGTR